MNYAVVIEKVPVVAVSERFKTIYLHGLGKEAVFAAKSMGWYVTLKGSCEALYVGPDPPDLEVGDLVTIRLERQRK